MTKPKTTPSDAPMKMTTTPKEAQSTVERGSKLSSYDASSMYCSCEKPVPVPVGTPYAAAAPMMMPAHAFYPTTTAGPIGFSNMSKKARRKAASMMHQPTAPGTMMAWQPVPATTAAAAPMYGYAPVMYQ